jgi:hypothetical protein
MDAKISPPQSDLTRGGFIFNLLNSDFFLFGRSYLPPPFSLLLLKHDYCIYSQNKFIGKFLI